MLFVLFDDLNRFICTAAIYDNIFKVRIILIEYRKDGLLYISALVKRRRYDGNFWIAANNLDLKKFVIRCFLLSFYYNIQAPDKGDI